MSEIARLGFLSKEELDRLHANRSKAWLELSIPWLAIIVSLTCICVAYRVGSPLWITLLVPFVLVLVGWGQFSISNGLHEAVHHNLGARQRDAVAESVAAWPIGFTMSYRAVHLDHHRYFGDPSRDPDYVTYAAYPKSRVGFILWLLRHLSGSAAVRQFLSLLHSKRDATRLSSARGTGLILTQALFVVIFWGAFGTPFAYLLWIVPLVTVAKTLSATRTFCEHGSSNGRPVLRTITGSRLDTVMMGSFGFDQHAAHHLYPTIPFSSLPEVDLKHVDAIRNGLGRELVGVSYERFGGGHFRLLFSWLKQLPWFERERP